MTKDIRLFEKQGDGKLLEVDASARGERRASRVALEIDVLWTAAEEEARDAEIAEAKRLASEQKAALKTAQAKLQPFLDATGLTADDLRAALGPLPT